MSNPRLLEKQGEAMETRGKLAGMGAFGKPEALLRIFRKIVLRSAVRGPDVVESIKRAEHLLLGKTGVDRTPGSNIVPFPSQFRGIRVTPFKEHLEVSLLTRRRSVIAGDPPISLQIPLSGATPACQQWRTEEPAKHTA